MRLVNQRRPHHRALGTGLALSLLLAAVAVVTTTSPASALSTFHVAVLPQQPLVAGAESDLSVRVTNTGPDVAEQVTLEIGLPAGVTFVAGEPCVDPDSCSLLPFGEIGVGDSYQAVVRVLVDPDYVLDNGGGAPSATAVIETSVDYDAGSQNTNNELGVGERSDLRVRTYANPPVADAGQTISYAIDVDNLGPSTARAVAIQDTLFGGMGTPTSSLALTGCTFSVSQGGGAIDQFDCFAGPVVTGSLGNELGTFATDRLDPIGVYPGPNPGDPDFVGGRMRAQFTIVSTDAITLDNEVRVVSQTHDPDASNNIATASHVVEAVADLGITLAAGAPVAIPGEIVTYDLVATNEGPSDAVNVEVVDHLPASLEVISATTPDGVCTGGTSGGPNDPLVCRLGRIEGPVGPNPPSAETITVTARVRAATPPGTVIANWASVGSDTPDRENSNDAAQADLLVEAEDTTFNPVVPSRQFDTRDGTGGVPVGKVPGGTALEVTVTGVNGIPVGATAVALNVTIANPEADGFASVYPCATPPGPASNLNFVTEQTVANAVIAPVDPTGKVCFFTTANANIISDVSGWFRPTGLTTFTPVRAFDTRNGTGGVPVGKRGAGSTLTVKVTGANGVPASGVSAVALNVTVADPDGEGLVNVYPCGAQPLTSSLNYVAQQTVPNLVLAPVSPQGTVCLFTTTPTHLLADVSGWFASGSGHQALNPTRLIDTRNGLGGVPAQKILAGSALEVPVAGRNGVPSSGAGSVILNVTATNAEADGYLTVYPCGGLPLASNVNYVPGRNTPNAVVAPMSASGSVCFYSPVATDVVVDVSGWFAGGPAA